MLSLHEAYLFDKIAGLGTGFRKQDLIGDRNGSRAIRCIWKIGGSEEVILCLESRLQPLKKIPIEPEITEAASISLGDLRKGK